MQQRVNTASGNLYPISNIEKEHLLYIYKTRLRNFVLAYIILIPCAFIFSFRLEHRSQFSNKTIKWTEKEADYLVNRNGQILLNLMFMEVPLIFFGIRILRKRIICFKKDAESGKKERITKIITRKSHFPLTGQYFISFDDPDYMHHEVDAEFYTSCYEGGEAYLYRAPWSKYIFNKDGVFSLL